MTRFEKLKDIDTMAKFLDIVVQDCDFCPCSEDNICECVCVCVDCVEKFKTYLSKECGGETK